ncbi:MAG: hypothetical protein R3E32_28315 [Chitinophagales bacterium]
MFRALVCVATLPDLYSLLSSFCSSVPTFAVLLTSVHPSRETTLQLANSSSRHTRL